MPESPPRRHIYPIFLRPCRISLTRRVQQTHVTVRSDLYSRGTGVVMFLFKNKYRKPSLYLFGVDAPTIPTQRIGDRGMISSESRRNLVGMISSESRREGERRSRSRRNDLIFPRPVHRLCPPCSQALQTSGFTSCVFCQLSFGSRHLLIIFTSLWQHGARRLFVLCVAGIGYERR